jgi:hypothetical protein
MHGRFVIFAFDGASVQATTSRPLAILASSSLSTNMLAFLSVKGERYHFEIQEANGSHSIRVSTFELDDLLKTDDCLTTEREEMRTSIRAARRTRPRMVRMRESFRMVRMRERNRFVSR